MKAPGFLHQPAPTNQTAPPCLRLSRPTTCEIDSWLFDSHRSPPPRRHGPPRAALHPPVCNKLNAAGTKFKKKNRRKRGEKKTCIQKKNPLGSIRIATTTMSVQGGEITECCRRHGNEPWQRPARDVMTHRRSTRKRKRKKNEFWFSF